MGGKSEEREVSLATGRMIMNALDQQKYCAFAVDSALIGQRALSTQSQSVQSESSIELLPLEEIVLPKGRCPRPDVVFIALHGRFGEDGTVQGLLELLEIPYVGSGVLASALAMNKIMSRKLFEHEGIPLPAALTARRGVDASAFAQEIEHTLGYPVVVKPNEQGSTIGISIVHHPRDLQTALDLAFKFDEHILVEEFVKGTEITGAVIGNDDPICLPIIEIVPEGGFYDYHAKYTPGATEEIVPARIPHAQYVEAQRLAIACHKALGCKGMSRTDMIVSAERIVVLEVNTIPGMTPTSLLPRAAEAAGISFPELLDRLIEYALEGKGTK